MTRGEVFELRMPRTARGHEQRGRRYGVVLQSNDLLDLSTVIFAPTSTRARAASFRPEARIAGESTRVLVEQLGAVDPSRMGRSCGRLEWTELADVDEALGLVLGLPI